MSKETCDSRTEDGERTRIEPSGAPSTDVPVPAGELLALGEQIGRFVVLSKLGEGGMAVVYAAYDAELDRKVAIKVLRSDPRSGRSSQGQARLLREAQAMARLSHPHIVQVYEVGKLGRDVFIAMEFIQGQTLRAWLKSSRRNWREVVEVLLQAGEGLAAAHAVGIVHRDFKPDNVLLGDDGRVRVLDFGLARPDEPGERAAEIVTASGVRLRGVEDVELTQAGAYIGTPAYMSPEQQLTLAADARSDQFGFCVALYEGLYGARPFAGETAAELRRSVTLGRVEPPPRGAAVPERLRAVVLRGLAVEPAARFPAMTDLLAELRRDPSEPRRRLLRGGLALLGLAALAGTLHSTRTAGPDCDADRLAGAWDDGRRHEVRAAFTATGLPYAAETLARVERDLDRFAVGWARQARARCEAAQRDVDLPSSELGELCLERRRVELRALVDVFTRADASTVEHASAAVERLRDPAQCTDPGVLASELALAPLPADRTIAAAVWALRERLAGVRFLELAGRYDEGAQQIAPLVDEARALGHPPALAEALLQQAVLAGKRADFAAAERALRAALSEAERAGCHALRAEAMVHRIELIGYAQARPEAVDEWLEPTLALVRHVAPGSALEGRALVNIGLMRYRRGDFAGAVESHEQAVALLGRVLKESDPVFVGALLDLGRSTWRSGRADEARRVLTRARSLAERELGPGHPILIGIYLNLANADDANEALYRKSLDLATRTFGPDHPSAALPLGNLGLVHTHRGDFGRALDLYRRAAAINRKALGAHPTTAISLANTGDALTRLGRAEEALAPLRESLEIYEKLYPEGHPDALTPLINLGDTHRRLGRLEESRRHLLRAREISTKHRTSVEFIAIELADTLTGLGAADEALRLLETIDPAADLGALLELHREWIFARALWLASPADRARARALAESVAARLTARLADPAATGEQRATDRAELGDIRAWLSGHPQ